MKVYNILATQTNRGISSFKNNKYGGSTYSRMCAALSDKRRKLKTSTKKFGVACWYTSRQFVTTGLSAFVATGAAMMWMGPMSYLIGSAANYIVGSYLGSSFAASVASLAAGNWVTAQSVNVSWVPALYSYSYSAQIANSLFDYGEQCIANAEGKQWTRELNKHLNMKKDSTDYHLISNTINVAPKGVNGSNVKQLALKKNTNIDGEYVLVEKEENKIPMVNVMNYNNITTEEEAAQLVQSFLKSDAPVGLVTQDLPDGWTAFNNSETNASTKPNLPPEHAPGYHMGAINPDGFTDIQQESVQPHYATWYDNRGHTVMETYFSSEAPINLAIDYQPINN